MSCESGIYHFVRETTESKQAKLLAISDKYGHRHNVIYDSDGKLIGLELSGGVKRLAFSYSALNPTLITEVNELTRPSDKQSWQPLRQIMRYDYNERQELIAASNTLGHTEQYVYDDSHLIIQRKMAGGAVFNWQWLGEGNSAVCHQQITNLNGIESRYEWDKASGKTTVYQSDGTTLSYVHNPQGKLISHTNAAGQTTTYDYNEHGQLIKETNPLGGVTQYLYNDFNKLSTLITPDGQQTDYYWWGECVSEVIQGNRRWQYYLSL
ncbi:hypothetical protein A9G35_08890 [Gilliamella sp. Choc5-1]|uniref:RHS repeat domain-containing protein n=1 Tax=Gilliamella sp. Choc5-1 TaxID=3120238 RepID=UPI00080E9EEB|nr:RHS repeat domain-containing protein [Gilliamella apicola]OCG44015.1 hypothetical protein A9G35_08890 [Gilliamella apicola]